MIPVILVHHIFWRDVYRSVFFNVNLQILFQKNRTCKYLHTRVQFILLILSGVKAILRLYGFAGLITNCVFNPHWFGCHGVETGNGSPCYLTKMSKLYRGRGFASGEARSHASCEYQFLQDRETAAENKFVKTQKRHETAPQRPLKSGFSSWLHQFARWSASTVAVVVEDGGWLESLEHQQDVMSCHFVIYYILIERTDMTPGF